MEKLTLTAAGKEIVINGGAPDGAVDLYSYSADLEPAARALGPLYVIGWRGEDTSTMGYMVSLIAALARREYYADPHANPRDAFTRTLRKLNEVVDEFFKSAGVKLSVGIFAVAGGTILVSKLDKFRILLARDGQVVDIMNNVLLFAKEHLEKRQFSNIISGSVHPGDRLLAYHPSRPLVARERLVKQWFLEDGDRVHARAAEYGTEHPEFAASFIHVRVNQHAEPAVAEAPQPEDIQPPAPVTPPVVPPSNPPAPVNLAWSPRQAITPPQAAAPAPLVEAEPEAPRLIPTEFALHSRMGRMHRLGNLLRVVRLDGRGKALLLVVGALLVAGAALTARGLWFTDPDQERLTAVIIQARTDLDAAREQSEAHPEEARTLLARALSALGAERAAEESDTAQELTADIYTAMDTLDNAQTADPRLIAQLDPSLDRILLATWSSASQSTWALTASSDGSQSVVRIVEGAIADRTALPDGTYAGLIGWTTGVIAIDPSAKTLVRVSDGKARPYLVPTQEAIADAAEFAGNLYLLTDRSILKVSDLDTDRPVTQPWLADGSDFVPEAAHLWVDGSIHTLGRDGTLTTYYKGKASASRKAPLIPLGTWDLVPAETDATASTVKLAVANASAKRVYVLVTEDASLARTLKIITEQELTLVGPGENDSFLFATPDSRLWTVR